MKQLTFLVSGLLALLCYQCGPGDKPKTEDVTGPVAPVFNINFSFNPPKDLDSNATPQQLLEFAWEEFFALNWQSSYAIDSLRDHPDTTWSFAKDQSPYPSLQVWETYAHRSELRPYSNMMLPFDQAPHYSYGVPLAPYPGTKASFGLFDVLDENNEIGSCDMYAHTDSYNKQYEVLYQAKVNRDEYEYVLKKYPKKEALLAARLYTQKMVSDSSQYYHGVKNSCNCPENYPGISLPCGNRKTGRTGTIEVKTAWRELTPKDDSSKFFKRTVVYFRQQGSKVYYDNKTYALIGLHIIHKTSNYENFVFATWEHVGVEQDGMGYQLLSDVSGSDSGSLVKSFSRLHPVTAMADSSTSYAHRKLKSMNPNSIWLNYRLIGVQAKPTMDSTSFNYFLANYVVESDPTLNDFHGSGIGHPNNGLANNLYRGTKLTMGGCQGCHGVAQLTLGTDFSFLLDNTGKPVYSPDLEGDSSKLQKLIRATQKK
jgi:hypothetical protein